MIINHFSAILGAKRLSQADVVRGTKLARGSVSRLYDGDASRVDLVTLDKVCAFLGVTVGDLLEYVPDGENDGNAEL